MPARAARPTNAEEVAKTVHDYLTSVEERAQKAEVAAVEARIKAAEERRARRLTLALAGTIVAAVALGGGGFYMVQRDREHRAAQVRSAVEAAQGEAIEYGRAGKPAEALAAARRALALADAGAADAALRERAKTFVAQAEEDLGAADREHKFREQDEQLRRRLVELRLEQIDTINNSKREAEVDTAFAQAFHDYGVDLEGDDIVPALKRIRERKIAEEVALALDDWGRLRRRVHGNKSEKAENLLYLAMDLDPEPGRLRLRKAIFDNDLSTMLELAAPGNLPKLAPGSIWVLSATLWDRFPEHRPDVYRMYDQAQHLYPGDFVLQSIGGNIYNLAGRNEEALVCRTAAVSLRPDDATARIRLQDSLFYIGRLTEAEGAARANVAAYPANAEAFYNLGMVQVQLGDYAGALANVAHSLELVDDPSRRADLLCLRFRAGLASKADVESALDHEGDPLSLATYMYVLLDHADPAQRDPEFVSKAVGENPLAIDAEWRWVVESVARVRLEDWSGANAALGDHFAPPAAIIVSPGAFDFLRALINAHLGRADAARESYMRGMANWNAITGGNAAAWEHSDVMRWRREAEAALAK
jgi:tetratricopeptide (TPR) repeat protein